MQAVENVLPSSRSTSGTIVGGDVLDDADDDRFRVREVGLAGGRRDLEAGISIEDLDRPECRREVGAVGFHEKKIERMELDKCKGNNHGQWAYGAPHMGLGQEIIFVSVVCCAQLWVQSALGMMVIPLRTIGQDLSGVGTNEGELSWMVSAWSLTTGIFVLPSGRLGDIYGHRLLFLLGLTWFGFWSLMLGFTYYCHAPKCKANILFDICRAFQGIGCATLLTSSVAILGRTYSNGSARKNWVLAIFAALSPNGFLLGGIITGSFAQLSFWPWGFWTFGITCFVLSVIAYFVIPPDPRSFTLSNNNNLSNILSISHSSINSNSNQSLKFDYLGTITALSGLTLMTFAWNQAPLVGWDKPYTYSLLIVGLGLVGVFFWVETWVEAPLVPTRVWNRSMILILICTSCGWSFGFWNFNVVQFLQVLRHESPLLSLLHMVPCGISGIIASVGTAILLPRLGGQGANWAMVIALVAFTISLSFLATVPVEESYWGRIFWVIVLSPVGMDMSWPAATIVASNSVPRSEQGVAASLVSTVVNTSISIGLGFVGTIQSQVNDGGRDVLKGWRGGEAFGIGLAALGIVVGLVNIWLGPQKVKDGEIEKVGENIQDSHGIEEKTVRGDRQRQEDNVERI